MDDRLLVIVVFVEQPAFVWLVFVADYIGLLAVDIVVGTSETNSMTRKYKNFNYLKVYKRLKKTGCNVDSVLKRAL